MKEEKRIYEYLDFSCDFLEDEELDCSDELFLKNGFSFDKNFLKSKIEQLCDLEKKVIKMYYGIDCFLKKSFEQIAYELDLTIEEVKSLHLKALRNLRNYS